jgi:hypothetical protein
MSGLRKIGKAGEGMSKPQIAKYSVAFWRAPEPNVQNTTTHPSGEMPWT